MSSRQAPPRRRLATRRGRPRLRRRLVRKPDGRYLIYYERAAP